MIRSPATTRAAAAPSARPSGGAARALDAARTLALSLTCVATLALASAPALATERPREPTRAGQGAERGSGEGRAQESGVGTTRDEVPAGAAGADADADDAAALARLAAFTNDIVSFRARFEQTLYDADSEPLQSASGTVVLKRPGRFVWDYAGGPGADAQTIVADGERIWLYDRELAQVTVNAIDERVAGTPFVLLMGSSPLEEAYAVTALGAAEGVEWLELVPKADGGDFEALFVGLDETGLAALELRDNFGQATQILFEDFEANVEVDDATFEFEVPEGVDVIGLER